MDVKLIVASGSLAGKAIPIKGSRFYIGRSEDCHLRPRSDLISRHHCAIILDGDYLAVRDFGSKNGTFVNGERVRGEQVLSEGDTLIVGVLEFKIKIEQAAKSKPKVESVQQAAARTVESASDDFDVDQWLSDEETSDADTAATADTRTINIRPEDTPQEGGDSQQRQQPDEEARNRIAAMFDDDNEEQQEPQQESQDKSKKPKFKKPSADSSQDAAASMLKNLFRK